jgi:hypothetical protein
MTTDKNLIGAAGEHLVLSRLLERGILASQAPRGARKADILVNPLDGGRPKLVQVKSTLHTGGRLKWHMKSKHEDISDKDMFYCFVALNSDQSQVYVIPAKQVAKAVKTSHSTWLEIPGKQGQAHNDSEMRWITSEYPFAVTGFKDGWMDKYLENWSDLA